MCTRHARRCLLFVFCLQEKLCAQDIQDCLLFVFCLQEKLYPVVRDMLHDAVNKYDSDEASKNFMDSVQTKVRSRVLDDVHIIPYCIVFE